MTTFRDYTPVVFEVSERIVHQGSLFRQNASITFSLFLLADPMIAILLSLSLSPPFHLCSLHHHQGLSTPRRAESGLAVPLLALLETETPDAQRGGRQVARSVCPSHCDHTRDRIYLSHSGSSDNMNGHHRVLLQLVKAKAFVSATR